MVEAEEVAEEAMLDFLNLVGHFIFKPAIKNSYFHLAIIEVYFEDYSLLIFCCSLIIDENKLLLS